VNAPFEFSIKNDLRAGPGVTDIGRHYAEALEEAKVADELGYRAIWTTEQHGWGDGYLGAQLPALMAFAGATRRLRVASGVLVLPYYRWRQVLEAAVIVDQFSGGRLELGVGAGVYPREFELFGVDMRRRGRLMEEGIAFLRQGLTTGELPDGPDGALVPLSPPPAQERLPLIVGGAAEPAVDRAVRLGDGYIGSASVHAEADVPELYDTVLRPAMERHGRTPDDYRFVLGAPLWISDDPQKDWEEGWGEAFRYQQRRYIEAIGTPDAAARGASLEFDMDKVLLGTVDDVARRLYDTWRRAPWHEFGFYHRMPGVSHERALEQLELVSSKLVPALAALAAADDR
jgi:alkanesulfonate monooxygenase SsuD/methylene tetrahydromethanopterin reductase-like flavin-dependent oxidoreductase (luciferase family)